MDVFPDMPAKHEFLVVCPATPLLIALVVLARNQGGSSDFRNVDADGDCGRGCGGSGDVITDCWRLDHARLIGGVNNTVQRRLLCR